MGFLQSLQMAAQRLGGGIGKKITDIGTTLNAPRIGDFMGRPGHALGVSLQNLGGQSTPSSSGRRNLPNTTSLVFN